MTFPAARRFSRKGLQDNAEPQFDKPARTKNLQRLLVDRFGSANI